MGHHGSSTVDISGIVWLDGKGNKDDEGNGSYGDGVDQYLSNVKVYLKHIDTNEIVKYNGRDYIETNNSGYYNFSGSVTGIKSSNLSNYYIEIKYNGIGTKYGIVADGTGNHQSKATHIGNGYASTDAINTSNNLHMNIGLREMPTETQSVEKWVDNVRVVIKDKNNVEQSYTYKYGQNNTGVGGGASVGIGNSSYYRTIYASDIIYSKQDNVTDKLQIYITYKIKVNNDTSIYQTAEVAGNKKEENMTVTLKDEYDSNYYELADNNWSGSNGVATYRNSLKLNRKGTSGYTKTVSITFKLTDGKKGSTKDALKKILSDGSFTASNKATISGEHQYQEYISYKVRERRTKWRNGRRVTYYVWVTKYKWETKYLECSGYAYAPGMTFSIYENDGETVAQRTISGTVFEDNRENYNSTGEVLGNGKYDSSGSSKENTVKSVKVELMYQNSNKIDGGDETSATIYNYSEEIDENDNIVRTGNAMPAETWTLQDGTYTFDGIIPGDYYIRFTYGDGTQTIIKANGTENVTAYEYKSTIIKNSSLEDMIKRDRKKQGYSNYYWYRNTSILSGYSTAVDVLSDRETVNANRDKKSYNMRAYTPTFKISIENQNNTSTDSKNVGNYKIQNMNFGIIDTPEIELGFEKVMTNIKVTNTSGQIIIDGNPSKSEIKNLSNLDDKVHLIKEGGSDYAKIEISNEELYGAKLEITYAITIINNSDVNYYEASPTSSNYGYYYMFGIKSNEVNITIDQVVDYLDEKLEIMENDHKISNKDTYKSDQYVLNLDGGDWNRLYTKKKVATSNRKTEDTAKIIVTRTLSNQDTNINTTFENQAELIELHITDKPKLVEDVNKNLESQYNNYFKYEVSGIIFDNPSEYNSLIVIPPTGSDKITPIIYIITTVISGIIITIGIIVIKKKVLNK